MLPDVCDQTAKPHVVAFRDHVLANYGGSSMGILRPCNVGGPSLHHQGLAWDWGMDAGNPQDQATVKRLIADLGTAAWAQAGLRSLIWDRKTFAPSRDWAKYDGFADDGSCPDPPCRDPHTNHVHFSFEPRGSGVRVPPPPTPLATSKAQPSPSPSSALPAVTGFAVGLAATVAVGALVRRW